MNSRVVEALASVRVVVIGAPVEADQLDTENDARHTEEQAPTDAEPKPVLRNEKAKPDTETKLAPNN